MIVAFGVLRGDVTLCIGFYIGSDWMVFIFMFDSKRVFHQGGREYVAVPQGSVLISLLFYFSAAAIELCNYLDVYIL